MSSKFDGMKWIFHSQQIFRLVSFKFDENRRKFITNWMEVIWSLAFIGIFAAVAGYYGWQCYLHAMTMDLRDRTKNAKFLMSSVEAILTVSCSMFFLLNAITKRYWQINFLEKMQKIDELLKSSFKIVINQTLFCGLYFGMFVGILIFYGIFTYQMIYWDVSQIFGASPKVFDAVYVILAVIASIYTLAFVASVTAIFIRTFHLNNLLKEVVRIPPEILEKRFESKNKMTLEVMKYSRIQRLLTMSVGDLNEVFGLPLVMNFAHDFIMLTSLIFMMFYLTEYNGWEASKEDVAFYIIWLIPNALKITFSCLSCHFARNEIEMCNQYLRKFSYEANEDDITDLVDMFSLQSIHLKTEFTANNFFSIDMSLFYSIISASTTYLVILIQFKNYDDDVDNAMKSNMTNMSTTALP